MKVFQVFAFPAGFYVPDEFQPAMGYSGGVRLLCSDKHQAHGQQRPRAPPASKCVACVFGCQKHACLPVWNH